MFDLTPEQDAAIHRKLLGDGQPGLTPLERELCEALRVLRNGYADAVAGLSYIQTHYGKLSGVGFDRVNDHFFNWVTMPEREGLLAGSHTLSANIAKDRTNG